MYDIEIEGEAKNEPKAEEKKPEEPVKKEEEKPKAAESPKPKGEGLSIAPAVRSLLK